MSRLLATILVLTLAAVESFGFESIQSRSLGMGRTVLLSRPTASDLLNIPDCRPDTMRILFEAGYNRRFELADLDHLYLAGVYRRDKVTLAFGASQFGKTDLYAEQLLKGSVTYKRNSLSLAASMSAMRVQIGSGYGGLQAATFGLGASWTGSRFLVSMIADNLTRPNLYDNGLPIARNLTVLSEYQGPGPYSITGRLRMEWGQKPQFGIGQMIRLSKRSYFFWGVATAPLEYGGGLEIDIPIGSISYATSVHPVLGFSHTVSLSFRPPRSPAGEENDF